MTSAREDIRVLNSLKIRNFRSIRNAEVRLAPTGLTVVVGANGAGKSNFVRALEFIANLHVDGLQAAIGREGGLFSILPKVIPVAQLYRQTTVLGYEITLPRPDRYPEATPPPRATHHLAIQWGQRRSHRVVEELIEYSEPIAVAAALKTSRQTPTEGTTSVDRQMESPPHSVIRFVRDANAFSIDADPALESGHVEDYFEWLGFTAFEGLGVRVQSAEALRQLLAALASQRATGGVQLDSGMSMLDLGRRAAFALAPQHSVFRESASNIRRFDLQLSELRREQDVVRSHELAPH